MKLLAIDFGMKRIGFAVGNLMIKTATPIDPIVRKNSKEAVQYIKQLVHEYDVSRIIIGYPLNMDGTPSYMTTHVENFMRRLQRSMGPDFPVIPIDERLSSFEAEEELKTLHHDYKKRKKYLDSMSALILLNRYMEETGQ